LIVQAGFQPGIAPQWPRLLRFGLRPHRAEKGSQCRNHRQEWQIHRLRANRGGHLTPCDLRQKARACPQPLPAFPPPPPQGADKEQHRGERGEGRNARQPVERMVKEPGKRGGDGEALDEEQQRPPRSGNGRRLH
jgi:hypothetical protein